MTIQDYPEQERIVITRKAYFKSKLDHKEVKNVNLLLLYVLSDELSANLFEGTDRICVDTESVEIGFSFSISEENKERLYRLLGHREIGDALNNYVLYVFAKIDQVYPITDDFSSGLFRERLNMSEWWRG